MNRLTEIREIEEDVFEVVPFGEIATSELDAFDLLEFQEDIYNKLAAYEDTGLEPSEVAALKAENERLQAEYAKLNNWDKSQAMALLSENGGLKQRVAVLERALKMTLPSLAALEKLKYENGGTVDEIYEELMYHAEQKLKAEEQDNE